MALASTLAGIFFLTTFFAVLALFIILRLAGESFRNYIKSKFGLFKKRGSWFIVFGADKKVTFKFKSFPKNNKVLIKSGDIPEEDQYASINEVYHQLDKSGNPVILAMEDLPFSFFLKKHHLDKFFPTIDKIINIINLAIENGTDDEINKLENKIKKKFISAKNDLKYIPDAWKKYTTLMNLNNILKETNKNKTSNIEKLKIYKDVLSELKQSIIGANHQIVNVYDLFQSVGFVKNITKMAFSEYQNGWLGARQTHIEKKFNTTLLVVTIIVGVFVLIGIYMTYSQNSQIQSMQTQLTDNSVKINKMFPNYDVNLISDSNNPNIHPMNSGITSNSGN